MIWLVKTKDQIPAKERELGSSATGYMLVQEEEPLVANKRKKVTELSCMEKASKCLNLKRPRVRSIGVAKHLQLYPAQASPQMLFDFSCDRKRCSARYQNFLSTLNFIYKAI